MSLVESIKSLLNNREELLAYRLSAAKFFFIVSTFLFFVNYIFLGTGFLVEEASVTFAFTYASLVVSYFLYTSLLLLYYIRGKMRPLAYVLICILALVFVGFFIPIVTGSSAFNLL